MNGKIYDQKIFREAHKDLIKSGTSKISLKDFEKKQVNKNIEQQKREYDARKISLR